MAEKKTESKVDTKKHSSSRTINQLFWGGLLVVVGGLYLLGNFGVIDVNTGGLVRLWPLFIILIGASVLSLSSTIWRYLAIAVMSLSLVLVALVGSGVIGVFVDPTEVREMQVERSRAAEAAEIRLETGAGRIEVGSSDSSEIVSATLDEETGYISRESSLNGTTQEVLLSTTLPRNLTTFTRGNDLSMSLTESLPVSLDFNIGAARLEADLRNVQLSSLSVDAGASDIDVQLGSERDRTEVELRTGASNVSLSVPESSGVRVIGEGGLSNFDFDGFEPVDDGDYQTSNYEGASKKIEITLRGSLSNFTVERY